MNNKSQYCESIKNGVRNIKELYTQRSGIRLGNNNKLSLAADHLVLVVLAGQNLERRLNNSTPQP